MKILALDSTEKTVTAALADDRTLMAEAVVNTRLNHSRTLLPMAEGLLKAAGMSWDGIDLFACSEGPGSFTGVRIGAATIKGLAFGRNKPCVGVSAPEAMAYHFLGMDGIVCPVMDARRSQLYNALFRVSGTRVRRLCPDRVIAAEELLTELVGSEEPIFLCGGGYEIMKQICEDQPWFRPTPEPLRYQSAFAVALCALDRYETAGEAEAAALTDRSLAPSYLRPSSAERNKLLTSDTDVERTRS